MSLLTTLCTASLISRCDDDKLDWQGADWSVLTSDSDVIDVDGVFMVMLSGAYSEPNDTVRLSLAKRFRFLSNVSVFSLSIFKKLLSIGEVDNGFSASVY